MGLESSNFIPEMDDNNPLGGDPKSEGDDHIRLTKRSVLGSFPGFVGTTATPKSVTKTEDEINDLAEKSAAQTISGAWNWSVDLTLDNTQAIISAGGDLIKRSSSNSVIGNDAERTQVRGLDAVDSYVAGVLSGRCLADGFNTADIGGTFKQVGFRHPTLNALGTAAHELAAIDESRVNQLAAGPLTLAQMVVGFTTTFINRGSADLAIDEANGVTLNWLDGGGSATVTGDRVLIPGSVCTLYFSTTTLCQIWGNGLS